MPDAEADKKQAFLAEYEQLCRKYGFIIDACGCCSSPWVESLSEQFAGSLEEHMDHLREG